MTEIKNFINSKKIIEISQKYLIDAPTQRIPEPIQTLGDDVELETKINIEKLDDLDDVEIVLDNIKKQGFSKVTHRTEWHHFFSDNNIAHNVLILIKDSDEVWIKIKKDKNQIYTSQNNFPILLSHERKIRPQDENYREEFQKTISKKYIGSFKKECLDFYFYYKNLSFTVTLSLADSAEDSIYQIEFEFDGHKEGTKPPNFYTILTIFEQMLLNICPHKTDKITIYTKIEWLLSIKSKNSTLETL